VQLRLTCSGVHGHGEAAPIDRYDESPQSALAYIEEHAATRSATIRSHSRIIHGGRASRRASSPPRAAFDIALHDLQGKLLGRPCTNCSASARAGPPTTWTIWLGDPDDMARRVEKVDPRFKRLKLKLGGRDGLDVRARACGTRPDQPADADRRQRGLGAGEALDNLRQLAPFDIQYCEQPLAADAMLRQRAAESEIPRFRSCRRRNCHTLADVAECAQFAHGINVKGSRSPAGSAKGCAWCTPPARSASGACSAA